MNNFEIEKDKSMRGTKIAFDYMRLHCGYKGLMHVTEAQNTDTEKTLDHSGCDALWTPETNITYKVSCRCRFNTKFRDFTLRKAEQERLKNYHRCDTKCFDKFMTAWFNNENDFILETVAIVDIDSMYKYFKNFNDEVMNTEKTAPDGKKFVSLNIYKMRNRGYNLQICDNIIKGGKNVREM